jgi:hypothetical protein
MPALDIHALEASIWADWLLKAAPEWRRSSSFIIWFNTIIVQRRMYTPIGQIALCNDVRVAFMSEPAADRSDHDWCHSSIRAVFGNRIERLKEAAGLGWTLMALARKKSGSALGRQKFRVAIDTVGKSLKQNVNTTQKAGTLTETVRLIALAQESVLRK